MTCDPFGMYVYRVSIPKGWSIGIPIGTIILSDLYIDGTHVSSPEPTGGPRPICSDSILSPRMLTFA